MKQPIFTANFKVLNCIFFVTVITDKSVSIVDNKGQTSIINSKSQSLESYNTNQSASFSTTESAISTDLSSNQITNFHSINSNSVTSNPNHQVKMSNGTEKVTAKVVAPDNVPNRESWSRMGREPQIMPVRPSPTSGVLSRMAEETSGGLLRRSSSISLSKSSLESLNPSLEALRMIRDSLNYNNTGDHHTFFVMGASVSYSLFLNI